MNFPTLPHSLAATSWLAWYAALAAVTGVLFFSRRRELPALLRGTALAQVVLASYAIIVHPVLGFVLRWAAVATQGLTLVLLGLDEVLAQLPALAALVGSRRRQG